MSTKTALAVVGATLLAALLLATGRRRACPRQERARDGTGRAPDTDGVQAAVTQLQVTRAPSARTMKALVRATRSKRKLQAVRTDPTYPGLAYCSEALYDPEDDGEIFLWPASDGSHELTITQYTAFRSATSTFDTWDSFTDPVFAIEYAGDFYYWDSATDQIDGPYAYEDAWDVLYWFYPADFYRLVLSSVWFEDNGSITGPTDFLLPAYGPKADSSYTCFN